MAGKEKAAWFWYYYKWYVLIGAGLVLFAVWGGISFLREYSKDYVLNIQLVNCETYTVDQSSYFERFFREYGYEKSALANVDSTLEIDLENGGQTSSSALQILASMFLTGEIDLFVSDETLFTLECKNHAFEDLRDILTDEQMGKYSECLYFFTDPDTGEEVPCGLYLNQSSICSSEGFYDAGLLPVMGVSTQSCASLEDLGNIIEYIMK